MAKGHSGLPKPKPLVFKKKDIFLRLKQLDKDKSATSRILKLETGFRNKITMHLASLPAKTSNLRKFNTSPYVLLIHSFKNKYSKLTEIEGDILPAKEFSSMETSAGRMIEEVALPIYGWSIVPSAMHTTNSALDGMQKKGKTIKLATLKSGPRCLNDEMSENFADAIINNAENWAKSNSVNHVEFSYGVLYGTKKQSNKKDWHILRNLSEKIPTNKFTILPKGTWNCSFVLNSTKVDVDIRIGDDWWSYLGDQNTLLEIAIALIRATVTPTAIPKKAPQYTIGDLEKICSIDKLDSRYNIALLQRGQFEWLLLFLYHFCDRIEE